MVSFDILKPVHHVLQTAFYRAFGGFLLSINQYHSIHALLHSPANQRKLSFRDYILYGNCYEITGFVVGILIFTS